METTLLGLAMPNVVNPLRDCLKKRGYEVQTMPTPNPVLVAYRKGSWIRSARQLIIEITSIEHHLTRVDITAVAGDGRENTWMEQAVEGSFASLIYKYFRKVI